MILILLIGFAVVALLQIPELVRKHWWRELVCFAVLWLMGFILSILITTGIEIPHASTIINRLITTMFRL